MAGGEVSPAIGARVDLAKRAVAVELAENFVAKVSGGMDTRPGQRFVARCKEGSTNVRILEFEFNESQTFVIEMGHQYARFHTSGSQILDSSSGATITGATQANPVVVTTSAAHGYSNGDEIYVSGIAGMTQLNGRNLKVANVTATTYELQDLNGTNVNGTGYTAYSSGGSSFKVYEISTPYDEADIFDIVYAQSGDVMTLCHPDYAVRELVRVDNDNWTLSTLTFEPEQTFPTELAGTCNTTRDTQAITGITRANPAVVTTATHGWADGDIVHITGVVGMTNVNHTLFKIDNVTGTTFELYNVDSGDSVNSSAWTAWSSGGTAELAVMPRQYTVTAINADTGEESLHSHDARHISISNITRANPAVVTTVGGHGLRNLDEIEISGVAGMTEVNDGRFHVIWISYTSFSLQRLDNTAVDSTGYTAYSSGGIVDPLFTEIVSSATTDWNNSLSWDAASGAGEYNVYASATLGQFGYIGTTTKNRFQDRYVEPDMSIVPPHRRNPFDDPAATGNYNPASVGFFDQRRIFGNTNTNPNRFFMTQIGNIYNFTRSEPAADDDAIIGSILARRINSIQHIVPLTDLILFTSGGEYRVTGDPTVTPSSIRIKPQSYYGSTSLRPIVAGEVGLFVSPGGYIRDFSYDIAGDKFVGKDVTVLARHLFDDYTLTDWDFAPSPSSVAWIVRSDGSAVCLTYNPEQDVYAWTRASTRGDYKSVCVVREGAYDIPYFVVRRTINGNTVQFIEQQDSRRFEELSDAFCVDAGLTLDNPITITGATAANPVVITTSVAHGFSNGDTVDINGIQEVDTSTTAGHVTSDDYNGTGYTIANVTATTFELQIEGVNVDGSAFAAYSSGGEVREAVTTVSGLWHLEGATVVAAANGYAEEDLTVSGGAITLSAAASRVHIGLPYYCRLKTLPISSYAEGGQTIQGRAKNISRLTVQVERTMGMWYGPDVDHMREAKFGLPALYGQPLVMVTDDIDVTMKGDWDKRRQVVIEQRSPLPMTILSLIPDVQSGGN